MNNSAEAEKHETDRLDFFQENAVYSGTVLVNPIYLMEAYHQFAREKELASLTDEKIAEASREYFPDLNDLGNATAFQRAKQVGYIVGAKEVRDYLKQNKLNK